MSTSVFAGHPLVTDDTGTQGKGKAQVELGMSYFYDKDKVDDRTTFEAEGGDVGVCITIGVLDTVDIVVGLPCSWFSVKENDMRIEREDGIGDITFDVKWRFFEKSGWSLAVKPGISVPTGNEDRGLGAGHAGYRLFLVGTKEMAPFAIHVNAGFIRNENVFAERRDLWHASAAAEVEVIKDLKLMANIGIERNRDPESENHPAFALAGISYAVTENITLDAGLKYGLTVSENDWTGLAGLAVRF